MIKAFASDRADKSFGIAVLPWRSRRSKTWSRAEQQNPRSATWRSDALLEVVHALIRVETTAATSGVLSAAAPWMSKGVNRCLPACQSDY